VINWGDVGGFCAAIGLLITLLGVLWQTTKNWRTNAVKTAEKKVREENRITGYGMRLGKLEENDKKQDRRILAVERRR
jgi:hypothetical protein